MDDSDHINFHAAWGEAKDRPDYHKPDWIRAQKYHENLQCRFSDWLKLVARTPGPWHISEPGYPGSKA